MLAYSAYKAIKNHNDKKHHDRDHDKHPSPSPSPSSTSANQQYVAPPTSHHQKQQNHRTNEPAPAYNQQYTQDPGYFPQAPSTSHQQQQAPAYSPNQHYTNQNQGYHAQGPQVREALSPECASHLDVKRNLTARDEGEEETLRRLNAQAGGK